MKNSPVFHAIRTVLDEGLQEGGYLRGTQNWKDKKKENLLGHAALNELEELYSKCNQEQILQITKAILNNSGFQDIVPIVDSTTPISTKIQDEYYASLSEFNRKFLATHLEQIDPNITLTYFVISLAKGIISRDFIDAMQLHPDAPAEYRTRLSRGVWNNEEPSHTETLNKSNLNNPEKKWYDIGMPKETTEDVVKAAEHYIYNDQFDKAIENYESISMSERTPSIATQHVLTYLADDDAMGARQILESYKDCKVLSKEELEILSKAVLLVTNYDKSFGSFCKNFDLTRVITELCMKIRRNII